jgi:hypothetical protein
LYRFGGGHGAESYWCRTGRVDKRCGTTARAGFCTASLNCNDRSCAVEFVTCKNMAVFSKGTFCDNCTQCNKSEDLKSHSYTTEKRKYFLQCLYSYLVGVECFEN